METHTIGIDLGKTVFHLVGLNLRGEVVVRKKFSRTQLLRFTAKLRVELIGMEACGGAHFLGRALREQGHEVRLIPAQYVKPYVKTNKSDFIDAEAIAEAVARPTMRFVPIKTDDQLDLQSLHRVRERWVIHRTAVINQIRGLLLERGHTVRKGAVPSGGSIAEDPRRRHNHALRRSALVAGATEAGTRSVGHTPGGSRCADSKNRAGERSLSTTGRDPWHWTCDRNGTHRSHWEWSGLS
jgi:transposase